MDYAHFVQMLLNGGSLFGQRLLKPETVAAMTRNQLPADRFPAGIGGSREGVGFSGGFCSNVCDPKTAWCKGRRIWLGWDCKHPLLGLTFGRPCCDHHGANATLQQTLDSSIERSDLRCFEALKDSTGITGNLSTISLSAKRPLDHDPNNRCFMKPCAPKPLCLAAIYLLLAMVCEAWGESVATEGFFADLVRRSGAPPQ